jgi:hypothetical protein
LIKLGSQVGQRPHWLGSPCWGSGLPSNGSVLSWQRHLGAASNPLRSRAHRAAAHHNPHASVRSCPARPSRRLEWRPHGCKVIAPDLGEGSNALCDEWLLPDSATSTATARNRTWGGVHHVPTHRKPSRRRQAGVQCKPMFSLASSSLRSTTPRTTPSSSPPQAALAQPPASEQTPMVFARGGSSCSIAQSPCVPSRAAPRA